MNSAFLTASKYAQGPFRTPILTKQHSSMLIPKFIQMSDSLSSIAKISGGPKEELNASETSSLLRNWNDQKLKSSIKKDEKIGHDHKNQK